MFHISSTRKSSDASLVPTRPPNRVGNRKKRDQVSCTSCRHRKLKCDRAHPCDKCSKRGQSASCTYANASSISCHEVEQARSSSGSAEVQRRLHHLENLVVTLMNDKTPDASNALLVSSLRQPSVGVSYNSEDTSGSNGTDEMVEERLREGDDKTKMLASSFGRISVERTETSYVGMCHWTAILDDIKKAKEFFEEDNEEQAGANVIDTSSVSTGPALLSMELRHLSKFDLLASIPPRTTADRLISRYIQSKEAATMILHLPTFQNEYASFWAQPWETSTTWLGLLFSIMCLAVHFYLRAGDAVPPPLSDPHEIVSVYRTRAAQCLILANYTKPEAYTLETLLLYSRAEFLRSSDAQVSVWIVLGITVRLAMRMGYHRDSEHYPNLSPFQGEMRRRIWALLLQQDLLASFQMGLPRMIRHGDGDTALPRNLVDDDFDQDSTQLPPSRPEKDQTPVSYSIVKSRVCRVFAMIVDQVSSLQNTPYEEILKLDKYLQGAHDSRPPFLRPKPVDHSITDPRYLIMQRYSLELLYQKARCVLHRNYLTEARSDTRYEYSKLAAVDAAMQLLQYQAILHRETQPGGQLEHDKWFMQSLTNSDFLLAAMVVCLDTCNGTDRELPVANTKSIPIWSRGDLFQAIETFYHICAQSSAQSTEANKACEVLTVMLRRLRTDSVEGHLTVQRNSSDTSTSKEAEDSLPSPGGTALSQGSMVVVDDYDQRHLMMAPIPSELPRLPTTALTGPMELFPSSAIETVESMMYGSTNINWAVWDDAFQTRAANFLIESWPHT